jgi:uncharacterized protein with ACT and thioredoxin-like domain
LKTRPKHPAEIENDKLFTGVIFTKTQKVWGNGAIKAVAMGCIGDADRFHYYILTRIRRVANPCVGH